MTGKLEQYREAAQRGVRWLMTRQNADGSFIREDLQADVYHKGTYAMSIAGFPLEAHRLVNWIKAHGLGENGRPWHADQGLALYKTSWIFQGAHRLGRFDVSCPVMRYILSCQAECGGFFAVAEGAEAIDTLCTGWAGVSCLYAGEIEAAGKAAKFLASAVRQQPEQGRFYYQSTPAGELSQGPYLDGSVTGQGYYFPGMAGLLLARYHQATGDQEALEAAWWLFEASLTWAEDRYASPPSGKSALAAAVYYTITGDERARDAAMEFGDYLLTQQRPDGSWANPHSDSEIVLLDHTAEFIVWLSEIAAHLGGVA